MRRTATIQYPRLFAPVLTTAQFPERVSEDRWHRPLSEPIANYALRKAWRGPAGGFAPTLTTAQFPELVSEDRWNRPLSEPVRVKALPTSVVAASGNVLVKSGLFPESVTADRWAQPLSQPKFEVGLRVASQPYISFVKAALFPESVTADRWFQPFSQPRFEYTLRAASQPYYAFVKAAPFEEAVSADRWFQPLATPIAPRRLPEYPSYSFSYFVAAAAETITPDKWYRPLTEPARAKLSISTGPFFVQAAPFEEAVSADRWFQPLATPIAWRRLPEYPAYSSSYFVAAAAETITVDKWHQPFGAPVRRSPPTPVGPTYVQAAPFTETVTADRWYQPLSSAPLRRYPSQQATFFAYAPAAAAGAVTFVASSVTEADSGTIVWPGATAAGDGAIILLFGNGSLTLTGTGWTQDITVAQINTGGSNFSAWHKTPLTAGDIGTPPTYTGTDFGGAIVYVAHGATGINYIGDTAADDGAVASIAGFTKDAASSLIATLIVDRTTSAQALVGPSGFTEHGETATTFFTADTADIASSGYTNSTSVDWSGCQVDSSAGAGLWEFIATAASETVTLDKWFQPFGLPLRARPFLATPVAFVKSAPFTETVSSDKWLQPLSVPLARRWTPQSAEFRSPFLSVSVEWVQSFGTPAPARRLAEYPAFSFSYFVDAAGEVVTPDKWHQPFGVPVRRPPPTPAGSSYVEAAPFEEAVSADRWLQPISQPLPRPRTTTGFFGYDYFVSAGETVTPDKWYRPLGEPPRVRLPTHTPPAYVGAAPFEEAVSVDRWLQPLAIPRRPLPRPPESQFSFGYFVTPETITMDKWFQPFGTPKRIPRTAYFPTLSYSYTIIVAPPSSTAVYMRGFIVNVGKLTEEP